MNWPKQTPEYTVAFRVALRMFESAFAACERVPEVDRQLLFSVLSSMQRVFEMNQHKQTPEYTTAYRVAVRMFESAFAACERVPEVDRQLLSQEISNRLTQMSHATNEPVKHCLTPMVHAANEPVKPKTVQVVGVEIK